MNNFGDEVARIEEELSRIEVDGFDGVAAVGQGLGANVVDAVG